MISHIIGACILVAVSAVQITKYRDCGSRDGIIESIDFTPCDAEPCYLKRGTNVTIAIRFKSTVDTRSVTTSVHGILGFLPIPFVGIPKDACASHDMDQCPINAAESHVYHTEIPVQSIYPLVRVTVKFELRDQQHHDLVCFQFPTEIVN